MVLPGGCRGETAFICTCACHKEQLLPESMLDVFAAMPTHEAHEALEPYLPKRPTSSGVKCCRHIFCKRCGQSIQDKRFKTHIANHSVDG